MTVKQFCKLILRLNLLGTKPLANILMALASQTDANSVVQISENPCFHYQYSSISKFMERLFKSKSKEEIATILAEVGEAFLSLKVKCFPELTDSFWLMNADTSPLFRLYSPTLKSRRYVYKANNQIKGNKPVDIGYEFSCIGLSARKGRYGMSEPPWNLPLTMELVPADENKNTFTAKQVNSLLDNETLPFRNDLVVNTLDSNYSRPEYIARTAHQLNLVNVIRVASNINVWKHLSIEEQKEQRKSYKDNKGARSIYGEKYNLKNSEKWDNPPNEESLFCIKILEKKYHVRVRCWDDMMIRTKRGISMKDNTFRLACIDLSNEDGTAVFERKLWLSVWGQRNKELSLEEICWAYRQRFDIEHFFRFGKQNLLLDKFETPKEENMDLWLEIVGLAYWMLWVAKDEAKYECPKWQKYDKNRKKRIEHSLMPSPSEVQRGLKGIILSFEQKPFLPKPQINGKGRKEGTKLPKKARHPIIIKVKKVKKAVET